MKESINQLGSHWLLQMCLRSELGTALGFLGLGFAHHNPLISPNSVMYITITLEIEIVDID